MHRYSLILNDLQLVARWNLPIIARRYAIHSQVVDSRDDAAVLRLALTQEADERLRLKLAAYAQRKRRKAAASTAGGAPARRSTHVLAAAAADAAAAALLGSAFVRDEGLHEDRAVEAMPSTAAGDASGVAHTVRAAPADSAAPPGGEGGAPPGGDAVVGEALGAGGRGVERIRAETAAELAESLAALDSGPHDPPPPRALFRLTASDDLERPIVSTSLQEAYERLWASVHACNVTTWREHSGSSADTDAATVAPAVVVPRFAGGLRRRELFVGSFGLSGAQFFGVGLASVRRRIEAMPAAIEAALYPCKPRGDGGPAVLMPFGNTAPSGASAAGAGGASSAASAAAHWAPDVVQLADFAKSGAGEAAAAAAAAAKSAALEDDGRYLFSYVQRTDDEVGRRRCSLGRRMA